MERRFAAKKSVFFFFGILKLEYDLIIFIYLTGFIYRFVWIFVFEIFVWILECQYYGYDSLRPVVTESRLRVDVPKTDVSKLFIRFPKEHNAIVLYFK